MSEDLRFPIGKFDPDFDITQELRESYIKTISELPSKISDAVSGLDDAQLDTRYRPEGWTVRQVVHHVADSHINSYCRFRFALTEDVPAVKGYHEDRWAELPDNKLPVEHSLKIIDGVHARWTAMLNSMSDEDFRKKLDHPEVGEWDLEGMLGLYDWHSKHHTAHITELRKRNSW